MNSCCKRGAYSIDHSLWQSNYMQIVIVDEGTFSAGCWLYTARRYIQFIFLKNNPVRQKSFVNTNCHLYNASVTEVLCEISCNMSPRYSGTLMYWEEVCWWVTVFYILIQMSRLDSLHTGNSIVIPQLNVTRIVRLLLVTVSTLKFYGNIIYTSRSTSQTSTARYVAKMHTVPTMSNMSLDCH